MSEIQICKTCRKPKAPYTCGICHEHICKSCAQFMTESFSAMKVVPKILCHPSYCTICFDENVANPLHDYQDAMEKAKDIIIYEKDQSKLTRLIKRKAPPYLVEDCEDQQEVLMRMSYLAVLEKYNCLIDVEFKRKNLIIGSHKKSVWSGSGVPTTIDPTQIRGHLDPP